MLRAILTLATLILVTTVLGTIVLTVGVVLPHRWCFNPMFRVWSRAILTAAGVRLTVEGTERFRPDQAYFFVGNHQSAIDIPVLAVATRGSVRFLAKKSLFRIPLFGWIMKVHGSVPIDRSSPRHAKQSTDRLLQRLAKRAESVVIFPEGTRIHDGTVREFKRGAIQICRRSGLPVVPFAIDGAFDVHVRKTFHVRGGPVRISFGEPMSPQEVQETNPTVLLDRLRGDVLRLFGRAPGASTTRLPGVAVTDGCNA